MLGNQILGSAIDEIAERLDGRRRLNERDHLQPVAGEVLRAAVKRTPGSLRFSTQRGLDLPEWPRLGAVDLAFEDDYQLPIAVELKAGLTQDALGPCAWDALKLAHAVRRGRVSRAYLLAATSAAMWERPARGAELLGSGRLDASELRERFLDWWRYWEADGFRPPAEVPAALTIPTRSLQTSSLLARGVSCGSRGSSPRALNGCRGRRACRTPTRQPRTSLPLGLRARQRPPRRSSSSRSAAISRACSSTRCSRARSRAAVSWCGGEVSLSLSTSPK